MNTTANNHDRHYEILGKAISELARSGNKITEKNIRLSLINKMEVSCSHTEIEQIRDSLRLLSGKTEQG